MLTLNTQGEYSYKAAAKSVAGRRNPNTQEVMNTPLFECVFFYGFSLPVMADRFGQPSGWPFPCVRYSYPESICHLIERRNSCVAVYNLHKERVMQNLPLVELIDDQTITTSRAIANAFNREHRNVTQKIEKLNCSERFLTANFSAVPYQHNGNTYTEYQITRDGFTFLAMGFTGKRAAQFKEAYIEEFNRMESELRIKQEALSDKVYVSRMRFLVTVEAGRKDSAVIIHPNQFISSFEELPNMIDEMINIFPEELMGIANACNKKLMHMAKRGQISVNAVKRH